MSTGPEHEARGFEATALAHKLAKRNKLLREARLKIHWAEFSILLPAAYFLWVAFRGVNLLESPPEKSALVYLFPLIMVTFFISQMWIRPLMRRVNAIAELLEDLVVSQNRT